MLGYHYGIAQYAFLILITLVVSVGTVGVPGTATITSTAAVITAATEGLVDEEVYNSDQAKHVAVNN